MKKKPAKKENEQRYFRYNDLAKRYGFSRGHLWCMVERGEYPPPMELGRIKVWPKEIVELYDKKIVENYKAMLRREGFKL